MKYIKLLLLFLLLAEVQTTFAQNWTVTGSYAYDMTVTAVLNADCMELTNPSNQLAAFVNGEVRGVTLSSVVVKGRYVALLTIRSNVASSESVSFKIYNSETDKVIDASTRIIFQDDAVYGTPSDPYEIITNYTPTKLTLATNSAQESEGVTLITSMNVKDLDLGDTHTFTLVSGLGSTDNAKFTISDNMLFSKGAVNYDIQNKYKIRIQATDNRGCYMSDTFTILLIDRNFSPTDITISNLTVNENVPVGTIIGSITSADIDKSEVFTYALVSGAGSDDNNMFKIDGNSFITNALFDYETKTTYTIRMQTKDSGNNTFEKVVLLNVKNVNDNPVIKNKTLTVDEKAFYGTVLGKITALDEDVSQTLTYSFDTSIPSQSIFGINTASGEITLLSNTLNYRTTQSYSLKVVATDNGIPNLTDTAMLTIIVLYQNYPPTNISLSNTSINENDAVGTFIANFSTFDKNTEDVFTYALVGGLGSDDNGSFNIVGGSLFTKSSLDYEVKVLYTIRIQTKDLYDALFEKSFVIHVTDVNEKPQLYDQLMTINEDAQIGTLLGKIVATNEETYQVLSYNILSDGAPQTTFSINNQTGEIHLQATLDYALHKSYTFKVVVLDGGKPSLSDTARIQIVVVDKNYPPTDLSINNDIVNENKPANSFVGVFSCVDEDLGEVFTYSLVNGLNSSGNSKFSIIGDSLFARVAFNYELNSSYSIRVQTKDSAGNILEKEFVIYVNDLNERPVLSDLIIGVDENSTAGTIIGKITASDEDENQQLTYSIVNRGVQNIISLNLTNGDITLVSNTLDYEKVKSYSFEVVTLDNANPSLSDTATLIINVLDVIENKLESVDYVSANADGKNDYWLIGNVELYSDYKLMIFDANGIMVYNVDSGYDNSWNGTYHGSLLPIGTYYYVLSNNNDGSKNFKGTITLVR